MTYLEKNDIVLAEKFSVRLGSLFDEECIIMLKGALYFLPIFKEDLEEVGEIEPMKP